MICPIIVDIIHRHQCKTRVSVTSGARRPEKKPFRWRHQPRRTVRIGRHLIRIPKITKFKIRIKAILCKKYASAAVGCATSQVFVIDTEKKAADVPHSVSWWNLMATDIFNLAAEKLKAPMNSPV
jgi:hypothetical protein